MSIYDDDDEGFGTPYPAARAKRRQASPLPRKNMTTREILEYCLDGYDEDMEPRRIHRNSTLKAMVQLLPFIATENRYLPGLLLVPMMYPN